MKSQFTFVCVGLMFDVPVGIMVDLPMAVVLFSCVVFIPLRFLPLGLANECHR